MSKKTFKKDVLQTKALIRAARISSRRAFSASKALGLKVTYIKDGKIYEEDSTGNTVVKGSVQPSKKVPFKVKKGLILHAK
jgi:hypothetical protein